MNITSVRAGDIVEVDKRGSTFHAIVRGPDKAGLRVQPLSRQVNYFHATAREVVGHWRASKATRALRGW